MKKEIYNLLTENEFKFKKKFGQNFITDDNVLNNIVDKASILPDTLVIEIGSGAGTLTKKIASRAKYVISYEIDNTLENILNKNLEDTNNIELKFCDFLKTDVKKDIEKYDYQHLYVIANLPYYITTPIIFKFIDEKIDIDKMIIMVQKEVGLRLSASKNTKDYNALSIILSYYFDVKRLFDVKKTVFNPMPNVDSSIVEFSKKSIKTEANNLETFLKLVKDSFRFKRKNLKNNLSDYNLDIISEVLSKYNKTLNNRAEELDINIFIDIANNIA